MFECYYMATNPNKPQNAMIITAQKTMSIDEPRVEEECLFTFYPCWVLFFKGGTQNIYFSAPSSVVMVNSTKARRNKVVRSS